MEQLNIKTILKQHQSKDGLTLEQHIRNLLNFVTSKQINLSAYDDFEIISDLLKKCHFIYKDPLTDDAVNNIQDYKCEISEWIDKCIFLLREKDKKDEKIGYLQNFQIDSEILKAAGVYFGEQETYLLQKSLQVFLALLLNNQKLTIESKASELHFWGKILCSGKDYYVAEGLVSQQFSEEYHKETEAKGTGVNRQTYWVTHSVLEEWTELPVVTPQQMIISRQIKYMFTGDLEHKVECFPRFVGKEKHLLKCIITRICFSCWIAPGDMYQTNEENDREIELREDFKMPEFTELQNIETWAHLQPNILLAGRVSHYQNMDLNEEDRAAQLEELGNNDPVIERLKRINEDRPFEGFETNWIAKVIGDPQQYNMIGRDEGSVTCYATIVLKNLTWPGFQCITTANQFINIYIGYGFKNGTVPFNPVQPNDLQIEPNDQDEHPEPNGKDPALEVEPDSDDENKDQEDDQ